MQHCETFCRVDINSAKLRAEDGSRTPDQQSAFRELVLIPCGFLGVLVLLILLFSPSALAQAGSGRIAGSVKDATGAVIPGSSISLLNTATGVAQNATSGADGTFNFPVVPIGQYELGPSDGGRWRCHLDGTGRLARSTR